MKSVKCLFVLSVILISSNLFAQGQIFKKEEANQLFGKVIRSITISKAALKASVAKCKTKVLFNIVNNRIMFANENKQVVSANTAETTSEQAATFKVVDINVMNEFLNSATETISFETRDSGVTTLTSGDVTLERILACPPNCM